MSKNNRSATTAVNNSNTLRVGDIIEGGRGALLLGREGVVYTALRTGEGGVYTEVTAWEPARASLSLGESQKTPSNALRALKGVTTVSGRVFPLPKGGFPQIAEAHLRRIDEEYNARCAARNRRAEAVEGLREAKTELGEAERGFGDFLNGRLRSLRLRPGEGAGGVLARYTAEVDLDGLEGKVVVTMLGVGGPTIEVTPAAQLGINRRGKGLAACRALGDRIYNNGWVWKLTSAVRSLSSAILAEAATR